MFQCEGVYTLFVYTQEVYERLVNKGKSKKLALIAVANKLIKQCFAMVKSVRPYDETYVSVLPR